MEQRIFFRFTTTHLIVANTGKVFSKEGFESLGYTDTSSKTSDQTTIPNSKQKAQSCISEIVTRKCNTFKNDPKELDSAGGTDQRTATDYTERLLLELLQNAIDAGTENQIGNKGIGFRSVLNGSKITEVHSGHFNVRWSFEVAKKQLKNIEIKTTGKRIPVLAFPAWCKPNDEIRTLLDEGYDTVIKLSLTPQGEQDIIKEWERFSIDPSILLFINNNIELCWEREGYPQVQWYRKQIGEIVSVKVIKEDSPSEMKYWRQFTSNGAISAYIVDNNQQFQESKEENPLLRSFFPAVSSSHPFPNLYLHHSDFKLQSNRQAIDIDEPRLNDLAEVIVLAASSMENETDILDLLRVIPSIPQVISPSSHDKRTEIRIWTKVRSKLAETKFKGLGDRRLIDIKSCPRNEVIPYSMSKNRWKIWEAFLSALKATRPNGISDLFALQPGTENKEREETLLKFSPDSPFNKEEIQKLPWAPVESSKHPVSSSEAKIFLPSEGKIQQPPDGVEVRFLTSNFLEEFRNKDDNADSFLKKILGVHEFSAIRVIKHCVLPFLETTQKHGASNELILFLKSLREANTEEAKVPIESFDWENPTRCNLARDLYLKCQKRVWPIFNIYADQKWTENKLLENVYWGKRGFLEWEPPKDEKEKDAWVKFWKWLGVGWYPKIMPLLDDVVCKPGDKEGLKWDKDNKIFQGKFFNKDKSPDAWDEYCDTLIKIADSIHNHVIQSLFERRPRIKENWTIDGGSQLLERPEIFYIIALNWSAYEKWMKTIISYSGDKRHDYENQSRAFPSFFLWLIQTHASWVPGADRCLHKGCKVFLDSGPVAKEIAPQFVTALTVSQKDGLQGKHSLPEKFLEACNIRCGWKEVKDSDWKSWLKKASEMDVDNKTANNREAVHLLYRALLDHRKYRNKRGEPEVHPINVFPLWGIERTDDIAPAIKQSRHSKFKKTKDRGLRELHSAA